MSGETNNSENFMLIASGSRQYAPFLVGWQDFKDNLRKIVAKQPGWTNVSEGPREGEMQGWVRLDRKDDAEAAYGMSTLEETPSSNAKRYCPAQYAMRRGILVHLFKTSRTNGDYRMLKCNCSPYFPDISERGHSPHRSGIDSGGVNQYMSKVSNVSVPQYMLPSSPMYPYAMYPPAAAYPSTPTYSNYAAPTYVASPQIPIFSSSTSGIPVNVRGGAMLTEARGIFINNLSYKVTPSDLNNLLSTVGRPVESKLHKDPRTGQFKGSATAKFGSKEEALYAVNYLNHKEHMGMTINVRLDTDPTVVARVEEPTITIVNGSNASQVSAIYPKILLF